jgi:hypothetical protein
LGDFFTLGSVSKMTEVAHIFGLFLSTVPVMFFVCFFISVWKDLRTSYVLIWKKTACATNWAIFSQTHLATLVVTES